MGGGVKIGRGDNRGRMTPGHWSSWNKETALFLGLSCQNVKEQLSPSLTGHSNFSSNNRLGPSISQGRWYSRYFSNPAPEDTPTLQRCVEGFESKGQRCWVLVGWRREERVICVGEIKPWA